ncbi:hypothetical protein EYF80_020120 [Liparis tanakae]|uniref:Uncharacterized protein n=1 Tax=Liparis tanakae TaxID=230148 RepID=A0A4Z2HVI8_9TELE|nr:hypothetical protein EYF80_020120 [Liparis tanakae]
MDQLGPPNHTNTVFVSNPVQPDRLRIAAAALPQRYVSGRMDGRRRPGGAEQARLKNRKALEEDAKCALRVRNVHLAAAAVVCLGHHSPHTSTNKLLEIFKPQFLSIAAITILQANIASQPRMKKHTTAIKDVRGYTTCYSFQAVNSGEETPEQKKTDNFKETDVGKTMWLHILGSTFARHI